MFKLHILCPSHILKVGGSNVPCDGFLTLTGSPSVPILYLLTKSCKKSSLFIQGSYFILWGFVLVSFCNFIFILFLVLSCFCVVFTWCVGLLNRIARTCNKYKYRYNNIGLLLWGEKTWGESLTAKRKSINVQSALTGFFDPFWINWINFACLNSNSKIQIYSNDPTIAACSQ